MTLDDFRSDAATCPKVGTQCGCRGFGGDPLGDVLLMVGAMLEQLWPQQIRPVREDTVLTHELCEVLEL